MAGRVGRKVGTIRRSSRVGEWFLKDSIDDRNFASKKRSLVERES